MFLKEKMECQLCRIPYTTEAFPYLLHCGHTICCSCFSSIQIGKFLNCPFCKKITQVEKVSKNLAVLSKLQSPTVSASAFSSQVLSCDCCTQKHPATKKCLDCGLFMCESLSDIHLSLKTTSKHKLIGICQLDQRFNRSFLEQLQPKSCLIHGNSFEFLNSLSTVSSTPSTLSNQKSLTGNVLLCSDCVEEGTFHLARLGKTSATSSIRNQFEHVRELAPEIPRRISDLNERKLSLEGDLSRLSDSREQAVSEIRKIFSGLMECLTSRQLELERQVEEVYKASMFELEEHQDRCSVWAGQLGVLGECVRELEGWVSQVVGEGPGSVSGASESPPNDSLSVYLPHERDLMVDICLLDSALSHALESLSSSDSVLTPSLDPSIEFSPSKSTSLRSKLTKIEPQFSSPQLELTQLLSSFGSVLGPVDCMRRRANPNPWAENNNPTCVMTINNFGYESKDLSDPCFLCYQEESDVLSVSSSAYSQIVRFRMIGNHIGSSSPSTTSSTATKSLSIEYLGEVFPPPSSVSGLSKDIYPLGFVYHRNWLIVVALDDSHIFIWDCEKNCLVHSFGEPGDGTGQFNFATCCLVCGEELFVSDSDNDRIQIFSLPQGEYLRQIESESMLNPQGMILIEGLLYVAAGNTHLIIVFDPITGEEITHFGSSKLHLPFGLLHYDGLLFVSNSRGGITVFTIEGKELYSFTDNSDPLNLNKKEEFQSMNGMVMVKDRLYVVDSGYHAILVFEPRPIEIGTISGLPETK